MSFRVISAPVKVTIGNMVLLPGVRYVVPAGIARRYAMALLERGHEYTQSSFNSYLRPYGGADLNGKRLAVFRHSAFGDQLMTTAVVYYLKEKFPQAKIDVYCSPTVLEIWNGLQVEAMPAPMHFEALRGYDWHLFYDQMLEENREHDQACAYDDMFAFAGLRDVPAEAKRPRVLSREEDGDEIESPRFFAAVRARQYLVYQLSAANQNRTYPYEHARQFIESFLNAFRGWDVVVVGKTNSVFSAEILGRMDSRVRCLVNQLASFRSLIPIVENAGLVVCPDSSIGHLAAAFPKVPVISLWGLFAPDDRAKYYPNHHPLFPKHVCPFAPCHNHEAMLPQALCAKASNASEGEQNWCNVLRAITPEMILAKAKELLPTC